MSPDFSKLGAAAPKPAAPPVAAPTVVTPAVPHVPALPAIPPATIDLTTLGSTADEPKAKPSSESYAWKRDGADLPGKRRRWQLLVVTLGLIGVAGVFVGILSWMSPPVVPNVLPIAIVQEPSGNTVAGMDEDRQALADGNWLGRPRDEWTANPSRDQIRLRFRALASAPRSQPVVVYLASPAAVDASGSVFLLPADRLGDHPRNRLPLSELLAALRDCPAPHRLLILNLVPPREDLRYAPDGGDLAAAIYRTLDATADLGRLCLVSCGANQHPHASPTLGRTVFGWYLEAGLRGEADGWDGESPDGRVTVRELAAYLREKVGRWTAATRGETQTPQLVGTADDFTLRAVTRMSSENDRADIDLTYPDFLRTAWERHDQWQRDGRSVESPWAFQKLRAALLSAEHDFLAGKPSEAVQRDLERQVLAVDQIASALTATTAPDPLPTLASLFPGYANPDPALLTELRDAAHRLDSRPAPAAATPEPQPLVPPEFDPFKTRPHANVALAAFLILADDPDPSPARVRGLAQLLALQSPTPKFAETALLSRLAALAGPTPATPWSSERAALALQTAKSLEESIRPEIVAWAAPAIEQVYRLRADAEAAYFAPGYVSAAEALKRLREAAAAARRLKQTTDRLRHATKTWHDAADWLVGATPAVQSAAIPFPVAEQFARATRNLGDTLVPPVTPLELDAFAARAIDWDAQANAVTAAMSDFARPFRGDSLAKLRTRAESQEAGPTVLAELEVLLATPLLSAPDRAALWNARAAISRRLAEDVLKNDATGRDAARNGLASRPAVNPSASATEPAAERMRIDWTVALWRVGGVNEFDLKELRDELDRARGNRFAFAERLRRAWAEDLPTRLSNTPLYLARQLACVAPIVPATALLDSPAANPDSQLLRGLSRDLWTWQAVRFDYESRELAGDDAALSFAVAAARACRAVSDPRTATHLELATVSIPRLTPEHLTGSLRMSVRAIGAPERTTVKVQVASLSPSEVWLKTGAAADVALDPLRQSMTDLAVTAGDSPVSFPAALGVLVEADMGGRKYHRRVPMTLESITDRLGLLVRTAPDQPPTALREIRLRPNGSAQTYQLVLTNPTPRDRKVVVRLAGLGRDTDILALPAGKAVTLTFPAPPPLLPAPIVQTQAPATPPPSPVVDEGMSLKGDELVLQVFDPTDRDNVRQTFRLPVLVANPIDYLRVTDPVYKPATRGKTNHLAVTIVPGDIPPGGPCNTRLSFPIEHNRGLVVRDGSLTGQVVYGGPTLTLYADNLALPNPAGTPVWVTVSADGMERALTYRATLPAIGEDVRLTPIGDPMVRVKVVPVATGTEPLPVTLEVDNAPAGARLELLIGIASGQDASIEPDLVKSLDSAKETGARLKIDPKGDTFLFTGSIKDHSTKLPIELLVGRRVLEARLLDRTGRVLDRNRANVIFDGTPPQNVRFLDLPPRARKDQPLQVRASCDPTVSGIKEVKFFIGQPQKNEPPAGPQTVAGKLFDEKVNEWRGIIPIAEGQKGVVTVGVQYVTNVGLSKIETQEVELLDPAEFNKLPPGNIAGKLIENALPQVGLTVFLYDDKGNAKSKTVTKADGGFEFKDLAPGPYYLYCEKETTNRNIKKEVVVKPEETLPVTLELLLK